MRSASDSLRSGEGGATRVSPNHSSSTLCTSGTARPTDGGSHVTVRTHIHVLDSMYKHAFQHQYLSRLYSDQFVESRKVPLQAHHI